MSDALDVGSLVAGRYELTAPIGEGGMGSVWAARHTVTGKAVALKFLKAVDDEHRQRFLREARVAAAIRHPNLVDVHDVLELEDGRPFLVMDLLEGEPLGALLERRGKLPVDETMAIVLPTLAGLGAAHAAGVVHRDVKPDNVFLAIEPDGRTVVKVLDFGIAKLTATASALRHSGALTQTGSVLGTPLYMAPEQLFGEKALDHRADLWALGIVTYECLTGRCPVQGDNLGQIFKAITQRTFPPIAERVPELDRELARLIDRMLASRPDDRPPSARAVAEIVARRTRLPMPPFHESTMGGREAGDVGTAAALARRPGRVRVAALVAVLAAAGAGLFGARAASDDGASTAPIADASPPTTAPVEPAAVPPSDASATAASVAARAPSDSAAASYREDPQPPREAATPRPGRARADVGSSAPPPTGSPAGGGSTTSPQPAAPQPAARPGGIHLESPY